MTRAWARAKARARASLTRRLRTHAGRGKSALRQTTNILLVSCEITCFVCQKFGGRAFFVSFEFSGMKAKTMSVYFPSWPNSSLGTLCGESFGRKEGCEIMGRKRVYMVGGGSIPPYSVQGYGLKESGWRGHPQAGLY